MGDSARATADAIERNLAAWHAALGRAPGAEVHASRAGTWLARGVSGWSNALARPRLPAAAADGVLREIVRRHQRIPSRTGVWVGPGARPADLEARLARLGFRCTKRFPAMIRGLAAPPRRFPAPRGLVIAPLTGYEPFLAGREIHPGVGPLTTDRRRYALREREAMRGLGPRRAVELLARVDGVPAGAAAVLAGGGLAGIYDVDVAERFRRRGIGIALIAACCRAGRRLGQRRAMLIASGMGESVYRRAGFAEACRIAYWVRGVGNTTPL